jgi:hypothetical protein
MLSSEDHQRHSPVYGRSRPKDAVSEGLMMLAEDQRPEANRLIDLRLHALQHHTCGECKVDASISRVAEYQLVAD